MTEREKLTFQQWQKTRTRVTPESDQAVFAEYEELLGIPPDDDNRTVAFHIYHGGHFITEETEPDGALILCLLIESGWCATQYTEFNEQVDLWCLCSTEWIERNLYDWVALECPTALLEEEKPDVS